MASLALCDRAVSENWHTTGFRFWSTPMSALGQKQTCASQKAMSALPPIATAKSGFRKRLDMCGATRDVRCGPFSKAHTRKQSRHTHKQRMYFQIAELLGEEKNALGSSGWCEHRFYPVG